MDEAFERQIDIIEDSGEYASRSLWVSGYASYAASRFEISVRELARQKVTLMIGYVSAKLEKEDVEIIHIPLFSDRKSILEMLVVNNCNEDRYIWSFRCNEQERKISVESRLNGQIILIQETSYIADTERISASSLVEFYERILTDIEYAKLC